MYIFYLNKRISILFVSEYVCVCFPFYSSRIGNFNSYSFACLPSFLLLLLFLSILFFDWKIKKIKNIYFCLYFEKKNCLLSSLSAFHLIYFYLQFHFFYRSSSLFLSFVSFIILQPTAARFSSLLVWFQVVVDFVL